MDKNRFHEDIITLLVGASLGATLAVLILPWPRPDYRCRSLSALSYSRMGSLALEIEQYRVSTGSYPSQENFVQSMQDFWGGPDSSLKKMNLLQDGWDEVIQYEEKSGGFNLTSQGRSLKQGVPNDIVREFKKVDYAEPD